MADTDMLEFVSVTSADVAEDAADDALPGTERGDFVLIIELAECRSHMHLRRGMTAADVAEGLRFLANCIDEPTDADA